MLKDEIENHLSVARVPLAVADVHQADNVGVAVFTYKWWLYLPDGKLIEDNIGRRNMKMFYRSTILNWLHFSN